MEEDSDEHDYGAADVDIFAGNRLGDWWKGVKQGFQRSKSDRERTARIKKLTKDIAETRRQLNIVNRELDEAGELESGRVDDLRL